MKQVYLCKTQDPDLKCKFRLKLMMIRDYYLCNSHEKVNECWGTKP